MTDNLDFSFDFGGADLDFDLGDFEIVDSDDGFSIDDRPNDVRYWTPRVDKREVLRLGNYKYARDFVEHIDLAPGARTYAWVDGSFIFGDIIERRSLMRISFIPSACSSQRCPCPTKISTALKTASNFTGLRRSTSCSQTTFTVTRNSI